MSSLPSQNPEAIPPTGREFIMGAFGTWAIEGPIAEGVLQAATQEVHGIIKQRLPSIPHTTGIARSRGVQQYFISFTDIKKDAPKLGEVCHELYPDNPDTGKCGIAVFAAGGKLITFALEGPKNIGTQIMALRGVAKVEVSDTKDHNTTATLAPGKVLNIQRPFDTQQRTGLTIRDTTIRQEKKRAAGTLVLLTLREYE